ncbi:SGNH/GDSL hydrolase family protein [Chitinophaga sp. ARDCPP14]|uniref:SGNH/GDSL hydrolase family protein n=1 Tax=Chitinophaga sp. ARDCPP14 TaxID=3391139 RepID=UPI003F51F5B5
MKHYFILVLCMGMSLEIAAQHKEEAERAKLIALSQAGASPLYFYPADTVPLIAPGNFNNPAESTVRNGAPHFFQKVASGKPVTIGFIGGSITQGNQCYRPQATRYIQSMYPSVTMKGINAGVSGTGTDLGACRLRDQLLQYHPDLVFVEFAVNGAYTDGMEGIVRQIRKYDPTIDICFIYTIHNEHTKIYLEGSIPENIQGLEKIADHYQLPSIHLGMEISVLVKEGKVEWKSDSTAIPGKIIFSRDGIHPITAGGNLYAAAIARGMNKLKQHTAISSTTLPAPLIANNWEDAGMYAPQDIAAFSADWSRVNTANSPQKQFTGWFPYIMKATQPGASFTFKFNGSMFGIFDIGGPEMGQLEVIVDGKPARLAAAGVKGARQLKIVNATDPNGSNVINRFNNFCNNRYRGQYEFISLAPGIHTVTIRLSSEKADKVKILGDKQLEDITRNPAKYDKTTVYIGKILLRGKPL